MTSRMLRTRERPFIVNIVNRYTLPIFLLDPPAYTSTVDKNNSVANLKVAVFHELCPASKEEKVKSSFKEHQCQVFRVRGTPLPERTPTKRLPLQNLSKVHNLCSKVGSIRLAHNAF
jgi:hypothetical protein